MKDDDSDLQDLILGHLDGRLSDTEFSELQERLDSDESARLKYASLARLDTELRDGGFEEEKVIYFSEKQSAGVVKSPALWVLAAAIVALAAWVGILLNDGGDEAFSQAPMNGVAVISAEAQAIWVTDKNRNLRQGVALEPGRLVLNSGLAQIDFYGGTSISLSGPAELELLSRDAAVLHRGRIKADVPPAARGFEIRVGEVVIEDLGTSFGLAADPESGAADLVVFDGEVRTLAGEETPKSYFEGDSVHLNNGKSSPQAMDAAGEFPGIADVMAGAGDRDVSRYARWKEASLKRRLDERLIAYYDFEDLTNLSRRLPNRAANEGGADLDGGIVGARVADGRWPQKTGLDFRLEGDRVRFQIPGAFDNLSIYAWVRIDALDRQMNSLFLTDYYDPQEFHWQLSDLGRLHFASSPKGVEDLKLHNRRFYSDVFWTPEMSGQWFLLATTVDLEKQKVIHFINGEAVVCSGGTNMEKPLRKFRIGGADLGNWTKPIWPKGQLRTLNGRIDEFALFDAVLSPEEIRAIYEIGKPD